MGPSLGYLDNSCLKLSVERAGMDRIDKLPIDGQSITVI